MSDKPPPKKGLEDPEAAYLPEGEEDGALTEAELLAWEERNKDALIASIREAQEQFKRGEYYTWEEVKAALDAQRERRLARKAGR